MLFEQSSAEMIQIAHGVRDEFTARFKAAVAAGDPIAYSPELGFANRPDEVDSIGYNKRAPIKFVYHAAAQMDLVKQYLPYFSGLSNCYEIGVGCGYLMKAMIDVHGIDAKGCDVELATRGVYRVMRDRLGIADRVEEQWILTRKPIRLPPGTEAVTTFMSVFDTKWDIPDYQWFIDDLRANGVRKVLWRPNRNEPETRQLFSSLGAKFPVDEDANRFFTLDL